MAVKKAPIVKAYQVNLYCDKCGGLMEREGCIALTSFPPRYTNNYRCAKCGCTDTSEVTYPYQIIEFDRSKEEIVNA